MKKFSRKLSLSRDTVRSLDLATVPSIVGGASNVVRCKNTTGTATEPQLTDFPCNVPVVTIFC
jgi:hypothetical protein